MKCVYEFKYLGIVFDENLSWNFHDKYIFPKLVNNWECQDALGGILHPTVLISFTQLIFVLLWIIETPCRTAPQLQQFVTEEALKTCH